VVTFPAAEGYHSRAMAGTHLCPNEGSSLSWPKWLVKILKLYALLKMVTHPNTN